MSDALTVSKSNKLESNELLLVCFMYTTILFVCASVELILNATEFIVPERPISEAGYICSTNEYPHNELYGP